MNTPTTAFHDLHELVINAKENTSQAPFAWDALCHYRDTIAALMDEIKETATNEITKYGKEGCVIVDRRYTVRQGRRMYRYDHHQGWNIIDAQKKNLEERMKAAVGSAGIVDEESGEVIPPAAVTYAADAIVAEVVKDTMRT